MNKILLFFIFIFWGTLLYAQDVVFDGVIFSADGKTLIKYPRDKVGEEYIVPEGTEIIGENAFEFTNVIRVTLPSTLKEIRDFAFKDCRFLEWVIWKNFPKIGNSIFWNTHTLFEISDDNKESVLVDGVLFSKDRRCLLLHPPVVNSTCNNYIVPEGTEIISERAFDGTEISEVILPSSLQSIENLAFRVRRGVSVRTPNYDNYFLYLKKLVCKSPIPPLLIGNPFIYPEGIELRVPYEYIETYQNSPVWKDFKGVYGLSINNQSVKSTKVWLDGQTMNVQSDQFIVKIQLYNSMGVLIIEHKVDGWFYHFDVDRLYQQGLLLLKVIYNDEKEEVFKLCKI
ncbi:MULTISPECIES: leucine-rich repeat domain-containing protein [Bacteroides]|uniref:leucine-rich repeat domain-containing protein n=1 Tax=Bacteroides TaxID=816 RepID=UPI00189F16A9|nr:leucine-rich repeat domain-containing protein [Bacteroides nordii]